MRKKLLKSLSNIMLVVSLVFLLASCSSSTTPTNSNLQPTSSASQITPDSKSKITISSTTVDNDNLIVKGFSAIEPQKSNYIQYYIGKEYPDTISECIYCAGFNTDEKGQFTLTLPVKNLKGNGDYSVVLEQNPASNKIITPEHWVSFKKDEKGNVTFGDITSMPQITNLALAVGMDTASSKFSIGKDTNINNKISINDTKVLPDSIEITGKTTIDPEKSTYIQYYIGKAYQDTLTACVVCDGINSDKTGNFKLNIPINKLKGDGKYEVVLEQNPASNKIITPEHWIAFKKDNNGKVTFGDITSMKEISNLALTVGMQTAKTEFSIGKAYEPDNTIKVTTCKFENGKLTASGKTTIDPKKSNYIQYYIGKNYPDTLSNCVICDGIKVDEQGNFELNIPYENLKGDGEYSLIFEQNPNANTILPPENWKAFYKNDKGEVLFGDISCMKEISNLALTVGMKAAETKVTVKK